MEELLINLVKEHPLYDKSHRRYKDRSVVVKNIWLSIEGQLCAGGHEPVSQTRNVA